MADLQDALQLQITLPSGRSHYFSVHKTLDVADLKILAQQQFQIGTLRLLAPDGHSLDPCSSLEKENIQDGDSLTAMAQEIHIASNKGAFVLWSRGGRRTLPQGRKNNGGDNVEVFEQLQNVQHVEATDYSFAAIQGDGSLFVWGHPEFAGDVGELQGQLKDVRHVCGSSGAFACVLGDGRMAVWGNSSCGGCAPHIYPPEWVPGLHKIYATIGAMAAIGEGHIKTWGMDPYGGDCSVKDQLKDIQEVHAGSVAFAAILADKRVVTWGDQEGGGDSAKVKADLLNVQQVQGKGRAFAALLENGRVVTWGDPEYGADSSHVQSQLKDVQQLCSTYPAFAALLANGTVVAWGDPEYGGDISSINQLKDVIQIYSTRAAFTALLTDGSAVAWGHSDFGGDASKVQDQLKDIHQILSADSGFLAIRKDGSAVSWGKLYPDGHGEQVDWTATLACVG